MTTTAKIKTPKPKLTESSLYLGDNGRAFCGRAHCAGSSAYYTGRDLSGQRVMRVTPDMLTGEFAGLALACEGCGLAAS